MNYIKKSIALLAISSAIISCSTDKEQANRDNAVRFTTGEGTRASGDQWSQGDLIGIRMLDAAQATLYGYSNVPYRATSNGASTGFEPNTSTAMYYPVNGEDVNFAAYYPYSTRLSGNTIAVDVSTQTVPEDIDLLWAKTTAGYNKTNTGGVPLQFRHMLSRLVINTHKASNIDEPDLTGVVVTMRGMLTEGSLDIVTGDFTSNSNRGNMNPRTVTDGVSYDAIVIPGNNSAEQMSVTFQLNGNTYTWKVPSTAVFEPGKEHTWEITLSKTGVEAIQGTIVDWSVGDGGTGTAD